MVETGALQVDVVESISAELQPGGWAEKYARAASTPNWFCTDIQTKAVQDFYAPYNRAMRVLMEASSTLGVGSLMKKKNHLSNGEKDWPWPDWLKR